MISAIVLAGGEGKRMGGGKPTRLFRGRPLLAWSIDAVAPVADEILVAVGPALALDLPFGARAVLDPGRGPLPAMHAAAAVAQGSLLVVVPCDVPLLAEDCYRALIAAARGRDGAIARSESVDDFLVACYRRGALLRCASEGAPRLALAELDLARVPWLVRDADTQDELARLE